MPIIHLISMATSKKFSTTIKQIYLDMKLEDLERDGFFFEYKEKKEYWDVRISKLSYPCKAVFLCGNKPSYFEAIEAEIVKTNELPDKYSEAINTKLCWRIKCISFK